MRVSDMPNRYLQWVPVICLALTGIAGHYNLQSQVVDLKARYESTNQFTREALQDIRRELNEQNELLRELNRTHGRSKP